MTDVDGGTAFGTWPDPTAQLIYHDVMPALLSGMPLDGRVVDLGGGNGLLKQWVPQALTVDVDATKAPDVVADILEWTGYYDVGVLRYVLHYLDDAGVRRLMRHLHAYHHGKLLVIALANDVALAAKRANSVNETKWFRSEAHLLALMAPWVVVERRRFDYTVGAAFYRWRLGHPNPTAHPEAIVSLLLERAA